MIAMCYFVVGYFYDCDDLCFRFLTYIILSYHVYVNIHSHMFPCLWDGDCPVF